MRHRIAVALDYLANAIDKHGALWAAILRKAGELLDNGHLTLAYMIDWAIDKLERR